MKITIEITLTAIISVGWARIKTFQELQVPERLLTPAASPMDPNWVVEELPVLDFPDLYQYFLMDQGQLLHRTNSDGELELFVLLDDVDPGEAASAQWGMEIEEAAS